MLQGTCLGEALRLKHPNLSSGENDNDKDEFSGPDGNGEDCNDLDIDDDDDDDDNDGSPGPVDGPSILSEVVLAQKRGADSLLSRHGS